MKKPAEYWIDALALTAHPEGGYFKETYISPDLLPSEGLPDRYDGDRACAKAIYFFLYNDHVSRFHRLTCEEIWCHHAGDALTLFMIDQHGSLREARLGTDLDHGERPQIVVPHDVWFGAKVNKKNSHALVSCITAPGFDFKDFELATRETLLHEYPQHKDIINLLT